MERSMQRFRFQNGGGVMLLRKTETLASFGFTTVTTESMTSQAHLKCEDAQRTRKGSWILH